MKFFKKTSTIIILFTVAFFSLLIIKPGQGYSAFLAMFSAAAAVIFGIFIVFSVSNGHDRLNKVNELLKIEDANNLLLYKLSANFGAELQNDIRGLMDNYLMAQVDYQLEDYDKSRETFQDLYDRIILINPEGKRQEAIYEEMINILSLSSVNRVQIETIVGQKLSNYEWISVWGLTFVVVSHLYEMSNGDTYAAVLLTILASASVLLVLVLRDYDSLRWQKDTWTWKPLHRLFQNMDLIPYYPIQVVMSGEAKIEKGQKIRLADYTEYYPNMNGKTIEVVEFVNAKSTRRK
jgi:hypothetical protein